MCLFYPEGYNKYNKRNFGRPHAALYALLIFRENIKKNKAISTFSRPPGSVAAVTYIYQQRTLTNEMFSVVDHETERLYAILAIKIDGAPALERSLLEGVIFHKHLSGGKK